MKRQIQGNGDSSEGWSPGLRSQLRWLPTLLGMNQKGKEERCVWLYLTLPRILVLQPEGTWRDEELAVRALKPGAGFTLGLQACLGEQARVPPTSPAQGLSQLYKANCPTWGHSQPLCPHSGLRGGEGIPPPRSVNPATQEFSGQAQCTLKQAFFTKQEGCGEH